MVMEGEEEEVGEGMAIGAMVKTIETRDNNEPTQPLSP